MKVPTLAGIHHLKFPVGDLARSIAFYERVLGATHLRQLDHHTGSGECFAVILEVPKLGTRLELRLDPTAARAQSGFDPVTFAVPTLHDLQAWLTYLDSLEVRHSRVLSGLVGWLVAAEDPDGRRLRFYTLETHGPEIAASSDPEWLGVANARLAS